MGGRVPFLSSKAWTHRPGGTKDRGTKRTGRPRKEKANNQASKGAIAK